MRTPSVWDCVPPEALGAFIEHLAAQVLTPGGRLVLGAYGSRTRGETPARIEALLATLGYRVAGWQAAGRPETARFAWIDPWSPQELGTQVRLLDIRFRVETAG
jgi:hypothetical protein